VIVGASNVIYFRLLGPIAVRILFGRGWEELVADPHLDVVGLAGEHSQRLVLRLPAKAGDCPVIAAAVRVTGDAQGRTLRRRLCGSD
jgi:hypothetical protein